MGAVFPVSSDPMPMALFATEIVGTVVSLPLTFLTVNQFLKTNHETPTNTRLKPTYSPKFFYITVLSVLLGCGIITFATISAMGI